MSQFADHCTKLLLSADSQQKALCFVVFIHSELYPKLMTNKDTAQFLKCKKKLSKDKHQYACPASAGGLIGVEWKSGVRNLQNTEYFRSVFGPEKRIGILAVFRLKILEIVLFLLFRSSLRAKKGFMRVLGRIFPKVIEYLGPKLKQV